MELIFLAGKNVRLCRINPNSTEQSSGDTNRYHQNIYCQDNLQPLRDLIALNCFLLINIKISFFFLLLTPY